jgi:F-type H+-transporting ATPase subunit epsilon
MAKLSVDVITAERVVFSDTDIDAVVAPGEVGELTVLPSHAALITSLAPGELRIQKAGADETYMMVTGGFLEVRDDKVVILAENAERAEEIDIALAQEARARAERMLASREAEVDLSRVQAELRRSLIALRVAERRRRRRGPGTGPGGTPGETP